MNDLIHDLRLVRQEPTAFHRGNLAARWLCPPLPRDAPLPPTLVVDYRLDFALERGGRLALLVSADQRYELFLDGVRLGRGPQRGTLTCWFAETHRVDAAPGAHCLRVRVWWLDPRGGLAPLAQVSAEPGVIVAAGAPHHELLSSGVAPWRARLVRGYEVAPPSVTNHYFVAGGNWRLDAARIDDDDAPWTAAPLGRAGRGRLNEAGEPQFRVLHGSTLMPQLSRPWTRFVVRQTSGFWSADDWQDLLLGGRTLTAPPRQRAVALVDLDDYVCGHTHVDLDGGRGSVVRVAFAEGLYVDARLRDKADRSQVDGRAFHGRHDEFVASGRPAALSTPWWSSGRYMRVEVTTDDDPLVLRRLALEETRYPLRRDGRLRLGESFDALDAAAWRTLEVCCHETFVDCPYYEQLQYTLDTWLAMLGTLASTRDDAPVDAAVELLGRAGTHDGLLLSRAPARAAQVIPSFSLFYAALLHAYAMWRGRPERVAALLSGCRSTAERFLQLERDGDLTDWPDGWGFVDWRPQWRNGQPDGPPHDLAVNRWIVALSLARLADLERWCGDRALGDRYAAAAGRLRDASMRRWFDPSLTLFRDRPERATYGEHAQALAVCSGLLESADSQAIARSMIERRGHLERTTTFWRHFVFDAWARAGLAGAILDDLDEWQAALALNMVTLPERPEPGRSDCHGYHAHLLYHAAAGILGVRPASWGFQSVTVRPAVDRLRAASGAVAHPRGLIGVEWSTDERRCVVTLPEGVHGRIILGTEAAALAPGENRFPLLRG